VTAEVVPFPVEPAPRDPYVELAQARALLQVCRMCLSAMRGPGGFFRIGLVKQIDRALEGKCST